MLGWLPVAVGLTALLRGLPVLMAAPQFLRHLRGPVGSPLLLSAIVPLLLANRPGRPPRRVVGRALLLPLFRLVTLLLPERAILFLSFFFFTLLFLAFLLLAFLLLACLAVLGVSGNYDCEKQREYRRAGDSDSLHGDTSTTRSTGQRVTLSGILTPGYAPLHR
jgi:hypothetical protein